MGKSVSFTDADLSRFLSDPNAALRDLDRIESEISLAAFTKLAWPQIEPTTPYLHNWHIDAICAHLEAVSEGEIRRLIINVPPGASKSTLVSVMFPAWEWGPRNMPGLRYIGTSYSERWALRDNNKTKNIVSSEWYQERWGDRVDLIKKGDRKIETSFHGSREAIPFGSLTAGRGDRLLIDDPHSTEQAESDAERLSTTRIFLESVPTRLNNPEKSAIIIIMQRLHEEDVSGVALSKDLGYEHLMLPMEHEPERHCTTKWFDDPRTKNNELLFPKRFPRHVVEEYKTSMGTFGAAGQLQQSPVPRGGGIFRWEWWQLWGNEEDPDDPVFKRFPTMEYIVASLDSAYTEKEENDFSALTIWGLFREAVPTTKNPSLSRVQQRAMGRPKVMLMHAWQDRLPLHELVEKTAKTCNRFKIDLLLIENKASGISVGQEMRRLHSGSSWGVKLQDPGRTDKIARAYSVQHLFADGMIYAPDRDWAEMVKTQMATFPKSTFKDLTDSTTQALKHLRDIGLAAHGFEIEQDLQAQMAYKGGGNSKPLYPV